MEDLKSYKVEVHSSKFDEKFYNFTDIARFVITYNFISCKDQITFEEWLINELISPLNDFLSEISLLIKNPKDKNEIYTKLHKYFLNQIANESEDVKENFKLMCQQLTPYWHKS